MIVAMLTAHIEKLTTGLTATIHALSTKGKRDMWQIEYRTWQVIGPSTERPITCNVVLVYALIDHNESGKLSTKVLAYYTGLYYWGTGPRLALTISQALSGEKPTPKDERKWPIVRFGIST